MSDSFSGGDIASAMSASSAVADPVTSPVTDPSTTAAGVLPAEGTASTSPAATDVPTGTTTDPRATTDPTTGAEPPKEKWPTILQNARTKATQETEAKFSWAAKVPEQHRATVGEFYQTLDTQPVMAIEALIATAANDPQQAPQLRSLLGRLLGNRAPVERTAETRQPPQAAAIPDPDFQDDQGNQFYSAARMRDALAALKAEIKSEYATELKPLKSDLQTRADRAKQAERQHEADTWAEARYAKVSQWPHFKAHEKAIAAAITNDPSLDVGDAYIQIVVPDLSNLERAAFVSGQRDKANAAGINPGNPASAVNGKPKSFEEAFAQMPAGTL